MAGYSALARLLFPAATALCLCAGAVGEPAYCGNGLWYPDGVCPSAPPPVPVVPQGPTPEQKEQMRQQALTEANESGISAYRRGDYATALRDFERALEYSPYNPTIKHNIARARQKLAEQNAPAPAVPATGNSAFAQLNAAANNSKDAVAAPSLQYSGNVGGTGAPNQARNGFDTAAAAPFIPLKFTKYLSEDADPVVPLRFRTPKIRRLEDARDAARTEAIKLERQRTALAADLAPPKAPQQRQPAPQQQAAEQKKSEQQQVTKQETVQLKKVQHLDFSIRKELDGN